MTANAWDGVPENPERDGWHFLHHPEDLRPVPCAWDAAHAAWCSGGMHSPQGVLDLGFRYLGPCLTPAEVAAREAASAEAMREACADVAQQVADEGAHNHYVRAGCIATRDSIRAIPLPHASALARALAAAEKRGMEKAADMAEAKQAELEATARRETVRSPFQPYPYDEQAEAVGELAASIRNAAAQESEG